uniref:Uncharacterized protein n=1 Tax=Aegilops tauschii subsp. strangulata TaxID=200361 RepID=A0A453MW25_AEGTS
RERTLARHGGGSLGRPGATGRRDDGRRRRRRRPGLEEFLIGGAGDGGEDSLAAFCDGGLGIEDVSGGDSGLGHSNFGKRC